MRTKAGDKRARALSQFAKDYGLNPLGGRSALVERITKASLIKVPPVVPSSMPVFGGRFWLSVPFILSLILTILVYFLLPSIGLIEVGVQVAAIIPFFLGVWRGLVFLDHVRQN